MFGWGLAASLLLHVFVVALVVMEPPVRPSPPIAEQAISVDIVPPQQSPENGQAKVSPSATATSPAQPGKADGGPSSSARDEPNPGGDTLAQKPALRFGKEDEGPRQSPDGSSTEDQPASPAPPHSAVKADAADHPVSQPLKTAADAPQPRTPEPSPKSGPAIEAKTAAAKTADAPQEPAPPKLREAKTLFSQKASSNPVAMVAMADLSRPDRAGRLCVTELRAQLLHVSPPYSPELLPSFRLEDGTVLDVPETAFLSKGQWRNLSYRCEVDNDAKKIVSFAFRIGDLVPRSEWNRRGLPSD